MNAGLPSTTPVAATRAPAAEAGGGGAWAEALQAAALFAIDPAGLGGVLLRGGAGPAQQAWLARLQALLPVGTPLRRLPLHIADERLLGGLDLSATLQAGRPVVQRGLLAEADGGVLLLAMAERVSAATAARLTQAMDSREVALERDGVALRSPARWGLVAFDEAREDDEGVPPALADRVALLLDLGSVRPGELGEAPDPALRGRVAAARRRLAGVRMPEALLESLCSAAAELGIGSVRTPLLALRLACVAAAWAGRDEADADDVALAAAMVFGPRATRLPQGDEEADEQPADAATPEPQQAAPAPPPAADEPDEPASLSPSPTPDAPADDEAAAPQDAGAAQALDDRVLAAAQAAIPAGLLARLVASRQLARSAATSGRVGSLRHSTRRGRAMGTRRGEPRGGARLSVIDTLRAAAPWQRLRRAELSSVAQADVATPPPAGPGATSPARIQVRREDFHVTHFKQRSLTTTVFVVDASGSSALNRLAEAKGAVELLLSDCYVRRDRVAVIAFRGAGAELLLPPTRSLVRAKRSLAGLPGGGGTPLAAGIDAARQLAESLARRGETPTLVLLTDGRANIARDGGPGRGRATDDALMAARQTRAAGFAALLLDTAAQPQPQARALAQAMGATYLPLPHAGAAEVSRVVRAVAGSAAAAALSSSAR